MRKLLFTAVTIFAFASGQAQEKPKTDPADGCPIFEMPEGDTVYTMKQYFLVMYLRGPERSQSEEEKAEIQKGHRAFISRMAEEGYLSLAGPMGDDTELRGILVFNVREKEMVEALMREDPAVQFSRLTYEIHPWWAAKGGKLK